MRVSAQKRTQNEARIRAAMDRLLRGEIPAGGGCDVKTLALESGVDRSGFYGSRPYAHLREEFEAHLAQAARTGENPDPREMRISRLKHEIITLNGRLAQRDQMNAELAEFKSQALSRLAAQHDEIIHLRAIVADYRNVRRLPTGVRTTG